jgi:hypothetical protein
MSVGFFSMSLVFFSQTALAEPNSSSDPALAPKRLAHISENCTFIKQALTQLQRADSRTRTYLGSFYETVANNFLSPINLRLVKNNRPAPDLMNIQSDFSIAQTSFRNRYTNYMRDLESLIGTDCKARPEEFATRLNAARDSRASLHESVVSLNRLISEQEAAVRKLQESLHD